MQVTQLSPTGTDPTMAMSLIAPPILAPSSPSIETSTIHWPHWIVVAPIGIERQRLALFNFETMRPHLFEVWLRRAVRAMPEAEPIIARYDRMAWPVHERYCVVNDLAEFGMRLPLYESKEAAMAAQAALKEGEKQ